MKRITALLLALVMMFALTACGGGKAAENETEPPSAGTAEGAAGDAAAVSGEPKDLEPLAEGAKTLRVGTPETSHSYSPLSNGTEMNMVYECLFKKEPDGSVSPWLAESYTWTDDLTLEVRLRDNVYFNNGDKLSGADILYSFDLAANNPASGISDKFTCLDLPNSTVSEDGLTVTFKFKNVYSPFLSWATMCFVTSASACGDWAMDDPRWWSSPVTTGAYEVAENVDGSHTIFRLRSDYWWTENMPDWDEITFNYFSNSTAMFIAYENGELDLVIEVDDNDYNRILTGDVTHADTTSYLTISSNCAQFLVLGAYKEEFKDLNVRLAIAHAIDPNAVGLIGYGSLCVSDLDSVIAKTVKFYQPQGAYEYSVELAKEYLAKSAYPDGFAVNVIASTSDVAMWEVVQAQLAEIGIDLTVSAYDPVTSMQYFFQPGATDMCFWSELGGNSSFDPSNSISPFYDDCFIACARILEPDYNEMFDQSTSLTDEAARKELYEDMQKWHYDNARLLPLVEPGYCVVYNNTVLNCTMFNVKFDYIGWCCTAVD